MPKIGTIIGYEFHELDDNAKDKVRYWLSDDIEIHIMSEDAIEHLSWKWGIEASDISWNLDDGNIAWGGKLKDICDIRKIIVREFDDRWARMILAHLDYDLLGISVRFAHRYYGGGNFSLAVNVSIIWDDNHTIFTDIAERIEDIIETYYKDAGHDTLRMLRAEYEHQQSEEYIREACEANEYIFDKRGNPIHHRANFE